MRCRSCIILRNYHCNTIYGFPQKKKKKIRTLATFKNLFRTLTPKKWPFRTLTPCKKKVRILTHFSEIRPMRAQKFEHKKSCGKKDTLNRSIGDLVLCLYSFWESVKVCFTSLVSKFQSESDIFAS